MACKVEQPRSIELLSAEEMLRGRKSWKYAKLEVLLKEAGVFYKLEAPLGPYTADLCIPEYRTVLEFSGHYRNTAECIAAYARKDLYLKEKGWRVFRISGDTIKEIAAEILQFLKSTKIDQDAITRWGLSF